MYLVVNGWFSRGKNHNILNSGCWSFRTDKQWDCKACLGPFRRQTICTISILFYNIHVLFRMSWRSTTLPTILRGNSDWIVEFAGAKCLPRVQKSCKLPSQCYCDWIAHITFTMEQPWCPFLMCCIFQRWGKVSQGDGNHSNSQQCLYLFFFPFSKYIFAVNQMFYGDNSSPSQLAWFPA